jgi:hypothetical protein
VAAHYEGILLFDSSWKVSREISRRADNHWLGTTDEAVLGEDDSFAVASRVRVFEKEPWPLNIYSANGETKQMLVMPAEFHQFAYSSRFIATHSERELLLLKTDGSPQSKCGIPRDFRDAPMFITKNSNELWLVNTAGRVLRMRLPAE